MANTQFKVDNGLLVTGGDSLFQANVTVNGHVLVRQTLAVNGDLTVTGNLTFNNTSISGELIPTANGVLLGNTTRTFNVFAGNINLSNSIVTANGTQINIRAGSGIVANTTGISVNASAISNGILGIGQGGTNAATQNAALNNLLPTQNVAVTGYFLKTSGTDAAWVDGIGFTGSRGATGFTGSVGFTGSQGPIGFTGSAGTNGFAGSTGFVGSQGIQGFTGSQGVIGFTGSTGPIAGSNTQITYNDSGAANGATTLTFNKVTGVTTHSANLAMANNYVVNPGFQAYKEQVTAITVSAGSQALDLSTTNIFNLTLASSTTLSFTNPPAAGIAYTVTLHCKQDGVGSRTITFPASVKFPNASAPVLSTQANKIDVLSLFTLDGGTTYVGALALANVG